MPACRFLPLLVCTVLVCATHGSTAPMADAAPVPALPASAPRSSAPVLVPPPEPPAGRWMRAVLTAYSPLDEFTRDDFNNPHRLTSTGVRTERVPYGIAADPRALPYGSRVFIPTGLGYLDASRADDRLFTVDDTGSIVRRRTRATGVLHLDLRYRSVESAREFGVREAWVYVLDG